MFDFSYCENSSGFFITYPFNVLSNMIFIFIGIYILSLKNRHGNTITAALLIISIGVGSSIWHFFSQKWLLIFDIGSIAVFVIWYLYWFTSCYIKLSTSVFIIISIMFLTISFLSAYLLKTIIPMNSAGFLPLLAILFGIGLSGISSKSYRISFLVSGLCLLIALVFRIIDRDLCNLIPFGTHFLWHIFCGLSLYGPIYLLLKETSNAKTRNPAK
ncbi:MAG: hypothetical protein D6B27_07975 [Gammaproteobacteria bacterium]|nr:MAG: hypothetical protein D6B27_07975 [Gammaproteobacteria bacterium]